MQKIISIGGFIVKCFHDIMKELFRYITRNSIRIGVTSFFPILVNVLVKDSTNFYWVRKSQDSNAHYTQVYDSFVIDNEYKNFVTQFKSTYKSELNRKYLFIDTINFGNQCKPDAELTTEFKLMNKYVADKNIKALTNWLKSGNTELQLFAVMALKFLKNNNENISKELMGLTELVLSKKRKH